MKKSELIAALSSIPDDLDVCMFIGWDGNSEVYIDVESISIESLADCGGDYRQDFSDSSTNRITLS